HTHEILQHLVNEGHKLYLYTGGDQTIQTRKVKSVGLDVYFQNNIYVATHKNTQFLQKILHSEQLPPTHTWMIGNSLRTDILPALEAGIQAVHIPGMTEWSFNIVDIPPQFEGAYHTIPSLKEFTKLLSR